MWTMLALLVITSLAWTAFVKPEQDRQKTLAESGIESSVALPQYQQVQPEKEGFAEGLTQFWAFTGFRNVTSGHLIMIVVGLIFIFLAIKYEYEPLLLVPIGTGILIGNIPFFTDGGMNLQVGIYQQGSVLNYLYFGVMKGVYPPLIFLGIGAMTDFSSLISNPRLLMLGAAAQIGIFATFIGALLLGFSPLFWMSALSYYVRLALMNMSGPVYQTFVMEHVEPSARATVASLASMAWNFGWAFSPTISGFLQVNYGFKPAFIGTITMYMIAITMYWAFFWRRPVPQETNRVAGS